MTTQVILLSGKQGSGKTTLQRGLLKELGGVVTMNFADVIYEMHDEVLKILHRYFPDRGLIKDGPLLQFLGTEWGRRTLHENIWVDIVKKKVEQENLLGTAFVIIGDCRFENEFDAFPTALRVRLEAAEGVRRSRCSMWRQNSDHPSEVGLDWYTRENKFDLVINTGTVPMDECVAAVIHALEQQ